MKKIVLMFCLIMGMFVTNTFSQEVRGVETRRVIYEGPRYLRHSGYMSYDYGTKYYGFEFKNANSIAVSIDIELYFKTNQEDRMGNRIDELVRTETIVLGPNKKYILKEEKNDAFKQEKGNEVSYEDISKYYVKYKAFIVQ